MKSATPETRKATRVYAVREHGDPRHSTRSSSVSSRAKPGICSFFLSLSYFGINAVCPK